MQSEKNEKLCTQTAKCLNYHSLFGKEVGSDDSSSGLLSVLFAKELSTKCVQCSSDFKNYALARR